MVTSNKDVVEKMTEDWVTYDIEIYDLETYHKNFLFADLNYFLEKLKFDLNKELNKLKNDRNFLFQLVKGSEKIFSGFGYLPVSYNNVINILEVFASIDLFKVEIISKDNPVKFKILVNKIFFNLQKSNRVLALVLGNMNEEKMKEKFEHAIRTTYSKKFKVSIEK